MKTLLFFVSALLVVGILGMVYAAEHTVTASVSVNTYVSTTLFDSGTEGVNFGNWNPGDTDKGEQDQNDTTPAISIKNEPISSVSIKVDVKGTDFEKSGDPTITMPVTQVTYDDDNNPNEDEEVETGKDETLLQNDYPATPYYTNVAPGETADFWFFIDIPEGQQAGAYRSTFTFNGRA